MPGPSLTSPSLFLYGFQVTAQNASIDFRSVALETPRQATLKNGFYSLTSLMTEIVRTMQEVDTLNQYTVTANRDVSGGTQNRVTISTAGSYLELLFGTGPRASSSVATLIGFAAGVDRTGALTYTGVSSSGTVLVTNWTGFNYLSPDFYQKVFGSVNISSSGVKESIVYNLQLFWKVQFKYITYDLWVPQWTNLMRWMIQQRLIEFTPEISNPTLFFEGSLESTAADGKGLGFTALQQLPDQQQFFDTGLMTFRQNTSASTFIT